MCLWLKQTLKPCSVLQQSDINTLTSPRKCTLTFWSCLQCLEVAGLCYLTLGVVLQVTGVGYNGQGEVLLNGEVIHGFSCQSISKIVEVRSFVSQLRSSH